MLWPYTVLPVTSTSKEAEIPMELLCTWLAETTIWSAGRLDW